MLKVLLVEDEEIKADQITKLLNDIDSSSISFVIKKSWQSGIQEIINNSKYDLIILDMSMPRYDSIEGDVYEEFETYAGRDILREMKRRKIYIPTFIVTAFADFGKDDNKITLDQLDNNMRKDFSEIYIGMTYFSTKTLKWKNDIRNIVMEVSK